MPFFPLFFFQFPSHRNGSSDEGEARSQARPLVSNDLATLTSFTSATPFALCVAYHTRLCLPSRKCEVSGLPYLHSVVMDKRARQAYRGTKERRPYTRNKWRMTRPPPQHLPSDRSQLAECRQGCGERRSKTGVRKGLGP